MPKKCCKETWEKIPEDEPVFIIRGKDLLAKNSVTQWISEAQNAGVDSDKIERAYQHLEEIAEFQINNPDRCKIPD